MTFTRNIFTALLAGVALAACSDIAEDERLIYVEPAPVSRAVLIEDFTGQRCINCPLATELIHQLQQEYGEDNIIAVGIHSDPMGFAGNSRMTGLMNDEGRAYGQAWGVQSQPIGLVNRVGGLKDRTDWMAAVHNEIQKTSPAELQLALEYTDDDQTLHITTHVTALYDLDAKLQLWLVQDNITAPQSMPDGSQNREYVHSHVFRAAINGAWGEGLTLAGGAQATLGHEFALDNSALPATTAPYVPEDCAVAAFLYDDNGVLQATKKALKQSETAQ